MARNILGGSGVAVFLATTSLLRADSPEEQTLGYLPHVGPSPLRFLAPEKPFKSLVIARPSRDVNDKSEENVEANSVSEIETPPPMSPNAQETEAAPQTNIDTEPDNGNSLDAPGPNEESTVSPQMLLKYFNRPTEFESAPIAPNAPVQFKAPPPAAPSSKATYSVSP